MHDIKNTRLLTAADELRLGRRIQAGDRAAKEELASANLRLVYALAARYRGRGAPFEDPVQEGMLAEWMPASSCGWRAGCSPRWGWRRSPSAHGAS